LLFLLLLLCIASVPSRATLLSPSLFCSPLSLSLWTASRTDTYKNTHIHTHTHARTPVLDTKRRIIFISNLVLYRSTKSIQFN
jgi:hypothetical protein